MVQYNEWCVCLNCKMTQRINVDRCVYCGLPVLIPIDPTCETLGGARSRFFKKMAAFYMQLLDEHAEALSILTGIPVKILFPELDNEK